MLKIIKQSLVVMGLMTVMLTVVAAPQVSAQTTGKTSTTLLPLPAVDKYDGNLPAPAPGDATKQFYDLVNAVIQNVRYILGAVAIALIVYSGLRMVIGQGNEDVYTKQRQSIIWGIIGLALVGLSGEIVQIFNVYCPGGKDVTGQVCTEGGFLKDPNAIIRTVTLFNKQTQFLVTFLKYIIGSIAILMIVRSGLRMITMGSKEDEVALDKKNITYGVVGLILIIISNTAISKVFYKVDLSHYPTTGGAGISFDPGQGVKEIVGATNLIVSIVGPAAVLALIAGAIMYVTAGGNEDTQGKAKRLITMTIIGIIVIFGAFAIVSTFISGRFDSAGVGTVTQPTGNTFNN